MDATARPAVDQGPDMPAPLVTAGYQGIGPLRMQQELVDPRIGIDFQHRLPGFASVSALVKATLAARIPQRPLCCHVHGVGIARIEANHGNMTGVAQPHIAPAAATVQGTVDPVAKAHTAL